MKNDLKIIALFGRSSSGKTETLNLLIDQMRENGYRFVCGDSSKNSNDRYCVLEHNGKKIGITTQGDDDSYLKNPFEFMMNKSCDWYICAARNKGSSVNFIKRLTENGTLFWHRKWTVSMVENGKYNDILCSKFRNKVNSAQAEGLLNFINELLGE